MSSLYRRRNSIVRAFQVPPGGVTVDTRVPGWLRRAIDDGWAAIEGTLHLVGSDGRRTLLKDGDWVVQDKIASGLLRRSNREFTLAYEKAPE